MRIPSASDRSLTEIINEETSSLRVSHCEANREEIAQAILRHLQSTLSADERDGKGNFNCAACAGHVEMVSPAPEHPDPFGGTASDAVTQLMNHANARGPAACHIDSNTKARQVATPHICDVKPVGGSCCSLPCFEKGL